MSKSVMSINTFISTAVAMPGNISVLVRGDHGIGKSEVVRSIARRLEEKSGAPLPVIDRRLSQMSEGDMIGLPKLTDAGTDFVPPMWFMQAVNEPVVLFLDELNRASPEVMQAAFQVVLDRELNGRKLHPETRVFAAINSSAEYNVNEMDPALLDRFWVVDLDPRAEEWYEFASEGGRVDPDIVNFLRTEPKYLDPGKYNPGDVTPSRRSWVRASDALRHAGVANPDDPMYFNIVKGFVGDEVAIALVRYVKDNGFSISAEDVFNNYTKIRSKIQRLGAERMNILVEKIGDWCDAAPNVRLTSEQEKNWNAFAWDLPDEMRIVAWKRWIVKNIPKQDVIRSIHAALAEPIVTGVFGVPVGAAGLGVAPKMPGFFKDGSFEPTPVATPPAQSSAGTPPSGVQAAQAGKKKKP